MHDILHVFKRRDLNLPVVIHPTRVQGEEADIQIAQSIGRANTRAECDVLIVGRGGGSLEDLWCFNHEIVARTIAASEIPIINAVGHEIDVTIADFVADVRALPSAAAELVSRDHRHKQQALHQWKTNLASAMRHYLAQQDTQFARLQNKLDNQHPQARLERQQHQIDELSLRLEQRCSNVWQRSSNAGIA